MNEEDQLEQSFQANDILQDPLQQPQIQAGESLEQWTLSNKNDFDEPYQVIKVLALELQVDSQQDQLSIRSQSAISNISRQTRSRQTAAQRLASREGMPGQISPRFFDSDRNSDGIQLPNRKNAISVKIEKKLGVYIYHIIESNLQQRLLKLKLSQQQFIQGLVQSTSIILASAFIFILLALIQEKYFNSIKFYAPLASPLGFHLLQLGKVLKDISSKGKDSLIQTEKLITQRLRLAHQVITLTKYVAVFLYIRSQTISPYLVLISLILNILSNFGLIYHIKHPQESKENMKLEENIHFLQILAKLCFDCSLISWLCKLEHILIYDEFTIWVALLWFPWLLLGSFSLITAFLSVNCIYTLLKTLKQYHWNFKRFSLPSEQQLLCKCYLSVLAILNFLSLFNLLMSLCGELTANQDQLWGIDDIRVGFKYIYPLI